MAQIFISYSRADTLFVEQLLPLLEEVFKQHTFWYDQHIDGGDLWWDKILTAINESSVFIFLLSHDSLTSDYCQAEFREALRLGIPCLPVIVRPKTSVESAPEDLQAEIKKRNWIDLGNGFKDAKANARLYSALNQKLTQSVQQRPVNPIDSRPTPRPHIQPKK